MTTNAPPEWHDVRALSIPIVHYELTRWMQTKVSPGLVRLLIGAIPNQVSGDESERIMAWTITLQRNGHTTIIESMVLDRFPSFSVEDAQTLVMVGILKRRLGTTPSHHHRLSEIVSGYTHDYPQVLRVISNQDGKLGDPMRFDDAVAQCHAILIRSSTARRALINDLTFKTQNWSDDRYINTPQRIHHLLMSLLPSLTIDETELDVANLILYEKLGSHRNWATVYLTHAPRFKSPNAQKQMAKALLKELVCHTPQRISSSPFCDYFTGPSARLLYLVARFRQLVEWPPEGTDAPEWDSVARGIQTTLDDNPEIQSDFARRIEKKPFFPAFYTDCRIVSRLPILSDVSAQRWIAQAILLSFGHSEEIQAALVRIEQSLTDPVAKYLVKMGKDEPMATPAGHTGSLIIPATMTELLFSVNRGLINKNPAALNRLVHHLSTPHIPSQQRNLANAIADGLIGFKENYHERIP